jgi:putative transposase
MARVVTQRGNRRQKTFFCTVDYQLYIELIAQYCRLSGTMVWAYCLMPNHVHLLLVPRHPDGLRDALGETHRHYSRHVNFREGWRGYLWQGRFHSFPMDENYLMAAVRYVERNPVSAGLCERPEQWKWSSAAAHLRGANDDLVDVRPMLDRVDNWAAYLTDSNTDTTLEQLIEKHSRTGRPLGENDFIRRLETITGRILFPRKPGPKP